MKKHSTIFLLIIFCFLLIPQLVAHADLIREPAFNPIESAFNPEAPLKFFQSGDALPPNTSNNGFSLPWLIIILVSVVVVGTFILIRILWKPKSKRTEGGK